MTVDGVRDRQGAMATTRLRAPGILLGIGPGGFVDGIVLHQILQWHHMTTGTGFRNPRRA